MNSSRVFRFSLAASTLLLLQTGCRDVQGPPAPPTLAHRTLRVGEPVTCTPASWMTESTVIGPEGGSLAVPGASVQFPRGALAARTSVSFSVGPETGGSLSVVLYPRGGTSTDFALPAVLTIDESLCSVGPGQPTAPRVARSVTFGALADSTQPPPADEAAPSPARPMVYALASFAWYSIAE